MLSTCALIFALIFCPLLTFDLFLELVKSGLESFGMIKRDSGIEEVEADLGTRRIEEPADKWRKRSDGNNWPVRCCKPLLQSLLVEFKIFEILAKTNKISIFTIFRQNFGFSPNFRFFTKNRNRRTILRQPYYLTAANYRGIRLNICNSVPCVLDYIHRARK